MDMLGAGAAASGWLALEVWWWSRTLATSHLHSHDSKAQLSSSSSSSAVSTPTPTSTSTSTSTSTIPLRAENVHNFFLPFVVFLIHFSFHLKRLLLASAAAASLELLFVSSLLLLPGSWSLIEDQSLCLVRLSFNGRRVCFSLPFRL